MIPFILISVLVLLIAGLPLGFSMGVIVAVYMLVTGFPISTFAQKMFEGVNVFVLLAIPLFMLAGLTLNRIGATQRIIRFCTALLGHFYGGLSHVNVAVSMIFAGMSGSSLADTSGVGSTIIPSMVKEGYSKEFSAAVTASSAIVGPIIPPSIPMLLVAGLAKLSVARLFLGGAIPGILFGLLLMLVGWIISRKRGYPKHSKASIREVVLSFKDAFLPMFTLVIILGGIFSGVFTPTEAAAVSVVYIMGLGFFVYRNLLFRHVIEDARSVARFTATIMLIVGTAKAFGFVLTLEQFQLIISKYLFTITTNTQLILVFLIIVISVMGCFMSTSPTLLLIVPMLIPMVPILKVDPIYFFCLLAIAAEAGTVTPPVGLTLFLTAKIAGVSPEKTFVAMIPFLAMLFVVVFAAIFFPPLITWLPNFVYG